jgi:hypothetical protein
LSDPSIRGPKTWPTGPVERAAARRNAEEMAQGQQEQAMAFVDT